MLVRCIANSTREIGQFQPVTGYQPDHDFREYLTVGREYQVLALAFSRGQLVALAFDDTRKPWWHPVGLFDFSPREIPGHWHFGVSNPAAASGTAPPEFMMTVWGYEALVADPEHSKALVEREEPALEIFFRELNRENEAIGRDPWAG